MEPKTLEEYVIQKLVKAERDLGHYAQVVSEYEDKLAKQKVEYENELAKLNSQLEEIKNFAQFLNSIGAQGVHYKECDDIFHITLPSVFQWETAKWNSDEPNKPVDITSITNLLGLKVVEG